MLYLLKRTQKEIGYDEYVEKLIRAHSEPRAREIANRTTGDEGKIWENRDAVSREAVHDDGPEGVIIDSFRAG